MRPMRPCDLSYTRRLFVARNPTFLDPCVIRGAYPGQRPPFLAHRCFSVLRCVLGLRTKPRHFPLYTNSMIGTAERKILSGRQGTYGGPAQGPGVAANTVPRRRDYTRGSSARSISVWGRQIARPPGLPAMLLAQKRPRWCNRAKDKNTRARKISYSFGRRELRDVAALSPRRIPARFVQYGP